MAIKYNIHAIGSNIDPTAPKKFYLRPVSSGEKTLDDLAADISHSSSLTESDVYAVLQSLVRAIPRAISDGYIVRLGNLGSFRMSVNSTGSTKKEDVRSEEHTSELQSRENLVCRLLLEKKKIVQPRPPGLYGPRRACRRRTRGRRCRHSPAVGATQGEGDPRPRPRGPPLAAPHGTRAQR